MINLFPTFLFLFILILLFHFRKEKISSYFSYLSSQFSMLSDQISNTKIFLTITRYFGCFLIVICLIVLGLKSFELQSYESKILPELMAPVKLTNDGVDSFERIKANTLNAGDLCQKYQTCKNNQEVANSINSMFLANYFEENLQNLEVKNGLLQNQLIGFPATYRGYYFHHYSTILFSYRELKSGNFLSALTNQYGLAAILPLMLFEGNNFYYYPLVSIFILMILAFCSSLLVRDHRNLVILGALILLIALTLLVPGVRISPGFSIYRFIPTLLITLLLYNSNLRSIGTLSWISLLFLLAINSLQFNILIYIIYLISLSIFEIKKIPKFILNRISLSFILLISTQSLLYYYANLDLHFPLFSSVETRQNTIGFGLALMIFPASLLAFTKLSYSWQEIFSYTAYALLATYSIAFFGSPQHYSNFLLISLPFIYLMIINAKLSLITKFFLPLFFYGVALNLGYLSFPININNSSPVSNYYKYVPIGSDLKFEIPNDIDAINSELVYLLGKYDVENFYFLSKDKTFIEMYNDKNIYPLNFDVFPHLHFIKSSRLIKSMKSNRIEFLVMDSPLQQRLTRSYIESAGNVFTLQSEKNSYLSLLERAGEITRDFQSSLLSCSDRYCLYRIN